MERLFPMPTPSWQTRQLEAEQEERGGFGDGDRIRFHYRSDVIPAFRFACVHAA